MPGGWTFCARRAIATAVALLLMSLAFGQARPARGAETSLPFDSFVELYVDLPRRHVFVSGGSGTNALAVYGFDGRLIRRVTGLAGAADMLVEGDRMYVALSNANDIAVVDLTTLEKIDSIDVSPYAQPRYLSKSRDTIYFTHGCTPDLQDGGFASVDLTTRVAVEHEQPIEYSCAEHAVVPNDPNTMFVWDTLGDYGIDRYNVTARQPVFVDSLEEVNFDQVTFSRDGETFYTRRASQYASEHGYGIERRRIEDFGLVMEYPRGNAYALTPDEGTVFASMWRPIHDEPDMLVYKAGSAAPLTRVNLDDSSDYYTLYRPEDIMQEAVGGSPAGDRVFAVVSNGHEWYGRISFRVIWPQYTVAGGIGDQEAPAASGPYEVWSSSKPRSWSSPLMGREDGRTFRISRPRTSGYGGGIDGSRLVYQQVRGRRSDLRTYDLERRRQVSKMGALNTRAWEWHPTVSGERILFGRFVGRWSKVILRTSAGAQRVLAAVPRRRATAIPGQVTRDWVVWTVCGRVCETYRLHLGSGDRVKMPRAPGRSNYAGSVTQSGVVYFVQSGDDCGSFAEILRWQEGRVTQIEDLPRGDDVFFTYADHDSSRVVFDRIFCPQKEWDVMSFFDETNAAEIDGAQIDSAATDGGGAGPLRGRPWVVDELPGGPSS